MKERCTDYTYQKKGEVTVFLDIGSRVSGSCVAAAKSSRFTRRHFNSCCFHSLFKKHPDCRGMPEGLVMISTDGLSFNGSRGWMT